MSILFNRPFENIYKPDIATYEDISLNTAGKLLDAGHVVLVDNVIDNSNNSSITSKGYVDNIVSGVYKPAGTWDASLNKFPSDALTGFIYYTNIAGTVDSVDFNIGDKLSARIDNPSTTTFNDNWSRFENNNDVTTVFGRIGSIVSQQGDYSAEKIDYTPAGTIVSTNLNSAINEIDTKKATKEELISKAETLQDNIDLKIDKTSIVDNLNSTSADFVLSSAQGKVLKDMINELFIHHVGDYKHSAINDNHGLWLKADGTRYSKTTYSELFDVIGYSFSNGVQGDTFAVPDGRDNVIAGISSSNIAGKKVGEENKVLLESNIPSHSHDIDHTHPTALTNTAGNHSHWFAYKSYTNKAPYGDSTRAAWEGDRTEFTTTAEAGFHQHEVTIDPFAGLSGSIGSGDALDIRQPTLYAGNLFIYSGVV
jgi:microcystin-dependent protein